MNYLCRAISRIAYTRNQRILLASISIHQSYSTTTRTVKRPYRSKTTTEAPEGAASLPEAVSVATVRDWPRPSEIPFQAKVSNSVHLIGYVHTPVQSEAASDGKFWAGTILTQNQAIDSSPVWIPVIFEDDLAHIVVCHLKENDCIYIEGQLTADLRPLSLKEVQANVQVMAKSINFVERYSENAVSPKGEEWVSYRPDSIKTNVSNKKSDPVLDPWREILDNPNQWLDYRDKKRDGMVKPKHPDFKRKEGGNALWLNRAPGWFLSEFEGSKADVKIVESKSVKQQKGDKAWKDLVDNPGKWWDNRLDKKNVKAPDFKHRETGEALWLDSSPSWVLPKLPPAESKKDAAFYRRDTILS